MAVLSSLLYQCLPMLSVTLESYSVLVRGRCCLHNTVVYDGCQYLQFTGE